MKYEKEILERDSTELEDQLKMSKNAIDVILQQSKFQTELKEEVKATYEKEIQKLDKLRLIYVAQNSDRNRIHIGRDPGEDFVLSIASHNMQNNSISRLWIAKPGPGRDGEKPGTRRLCNGPIGEKAEINYVSGKIKLILKRRSTAHIRFFRVEVLGFDVTWEDLKTNATEPFCTVV